MQDPRQKKNSRDQLEHLDQASVDEDYNVDYYDTVADIDIRSQAKKKPRRGGKSGGYGK